MFVQDGACEHSVRRVWRNLYPELYEGAGRLKKISRFDVTFRYHLSK